MSYEELINKLSAADYERRYDTSDWSSFPRVELVDLPDFADLKVINYRPMRTTLAFEVLVSIAGASPVCLQISDCWLSLTEHLLCLRLGQAMERKVAVIEGRSIKGAY